MMLPVRTTVSHQAADWDYEASSEQRATPDFYKTVQALVSAYLLRMFLWLNENMAMQFIVNIFYCSLSA